MTADGPEALVERAASFLKGGRVRLRRLLDRDLPVLVDWNLDARVAVPHLTSSAGLSEPALRAAFGQWAARSEHGAVAFAIEVLQGTGESPALIGAARIGEPDAAARSAVFAMFLGPGHLGKGYSAEAAGLVLRYAFEELGLHRLEARTLAVNSRAVRAFTRAGFVEEGRLRGAVRMEDVLLLGALDPGGGSRVG